MAAITSSPSSSLTDEYITFNYLRRKIYGFPMPKDASSVMEDDLYGEKEPWEIWDSLDRREKDEILIFSRVKYAATASESDCPRLIRRIGSGTWVRDEESRKKSIAVHGRYAVMKRYRYENRMVKEHDGMWVMEEYQYLGRDGDYHDQVLCRLKKGEKAGGRKRKLSQRVEERESESPGNQVRDFEHCPEGGVREEEGNSANGVYTNWALEFAEELRNGQESISEPEIAMVDNPCSSDVMGWQLLN